MATFTNQATLKYNGNTINSNITTGELLEVLSATKTAVTSTYGQGTDITYVINIVNSGTVAFSGITVTDNLGAYTFGLGNLVPLEYVEDSAKYYINGVLQSSVNVTAGTSLEFSGITVPAGGVVTIIYVAQTNQYAPLETGSLIANTAIISGENITDITVEASVERDEDTVLTINKTMCPVVISESGTITYTFIIQNTGTKEAGASDSVIVTDTFEPVLTNLTVTYNNTNWVQGTNYTYSELTGVFETALGEITVPAATYTQDATTGEWIIQPGVSIITVTGTI